MSGSVSQRKGSSEQGFKDKQKLTRLKKKEEEEEEWWEEGGGGGGCG